jgi:hypothetical protein
MTASLSERAAFSRGMACRGPEFPMRRCVRRHCQSATCIRFNESALHHVVMMDTIKTVILSSTFGQLYASNFLVGDKVEKPDAKTLRTKFLATLSALRTAQKKVIVIAPLPSPNNINIGECLERKAQGIFVFPVLRNDCSFSYEDYQAAWPRTIKLLRTMETLDHINVVWPESVTCDNQICAAQIDGTPIYRDTGHITYDASILLTRMLHVGDKLDLALNAVEPETAIKRVQVSR